ncbi:MAG: hypothetical protein ABI035_01845 [Gemmatimonadaceae bacterium]
MAKSEVFGRGALAGVLAMVGAIAAHWFITPARHPDAGRWAQIATLVELVVGFGGAAWLTWRQARSEAHLRGEQRAQR